MKTNLSRKPFSFPIPWIGLVPLLVACHRVPPSPDASPPQTASDSITLAADSPQLSALTVEPVQTSRPTRVALAGRLVWDEERTVRVFSPFSGIIRKLRVDLNQHVNQGSPLAELQSPDFIQAQSEARKAQSDFRRARQTLERVRDLFDHGASPRKELESAEADFASAQAERDRAEARLQIYGATADISNTGFFLPSPLEGVLVERNVTPGQEVRPDQMLANAPQYMAPLFVITDPSHLWIQVDATELDLPHLRPGCGFTFTSHAFPGQSFTGTVATVSEFIDPATRTIKVRGTVDNPRRLLKAEMFVSVSLPGANTEGVSVPAKAVFLQGDKHYVFIERSPGQFVRREVQTGDEQDGQILVLAGVESGQRVVTEGCVLLQQAIK